MYPWCFSTQIINATIAASVDEVGQMDFHFFLPLLYFCAQSFNDLQNDKPKCLPKFCADRAIRHCASVCIAIFLLIFHRSKAFLVPIWPQYVPIARISCRRFTKFEYFGSKLCKFCIYFCASGRQSVAKQ